MRASFLTSDDEPESINLAESRRVTPRIGPTHQAARTGYFS